MFKKSKIQNQQINRPRRPGLSSDRPGQSTPLTYYKGSTSSQNTDNKRNTNTSSADKAVQFVKLIPAILAILVIIGSIIFSMTLDSSVDVKVFDDGQSPFRDINEYSTVAGQIMNDNLSNKTKFTISSDDFETKFMEKFPELDNAALRLPVLGRKPTLVIDIRKPSVILATNTSGAVIDESGTAVSDIKQLDAKHKEGLPVVVDESGTAIEIGKQVLPSETIKFILDIKAQMDAKGIKVTRLVLPVSINEIDIYPEGIKYYVKTDASGDSRLQLGSFFAVKEDLESKRVTPTEYIDVRVEEKAFYK